MLAITNQLFIADNEFEIHAVRAQGAGGQNVNKVSSAVHLRFDIRASSLPEEIQQRLLAHHDRRITKDGVVVIKGQEHRTFEKNRAAAQQRLVELIRSVLVRPRTRKPTRPGRKAAQRRLEAKTRRARVKQTRQKVAVDRD